MSVVAAIIVAIATAEALAMVSNVMLASLLNTVAPRGYCRKGRLHMQAASTRTSHAAHSPAAIVSGPPY